MRYDQEYNRNQRRGSRGNRDLRRDFRDSRDSSDRDFRYSEFGAEDHLPYEGRESGSLYRPSSYREERGSFGGDRYRDFSREHSGNRDYSQSSPSAHLSPSFGSGAGYGSDSRHTSDWGRYNLHDNWSERNNSRRDWSSPSSDSYERPAEFSRDWPSSSSEYNREYYRDYGRGAGQEHSLWESVKEGVKDFFGVGPKGYRRSDERIKEEVSDALMRDRHVDASQITVEVKEGKVILTGTVSDRAMKRRAEDCVEHLSGVHDVRNELEVAASPRLTSSEGSRLSGAEGGFSTGLNTGSETQPPSRNSSKRNTQ